MLDEITTRTFSESLWSDLSAGRRKGAGRNERNVNVKEHVDSLSYTSTPCVTKCHACDIPILVTLQDPEWLNGKIACFFWPHCVFDSQSSKHIMLGLLVYRVVSIVRARIVCVLDYEAVCKSSISIFELLVTTYLLDLYVIYLLWAVKYIAFPCFLMNTLSY